MTASLALILLLLPAVAQVADAQQGIKPRWARISFKKYIESVQYVSILKRAVEVADERNRPSCYGRELVRPYRFRIEDLQFSRKTRRPVRGYWREVLVVRGCDAPLPYPVWMFLTGPKKVFAFAVVPGRTRADAYQMRAGMHQVLRASAKAVLGCRRVRFIGSKPTSGSAESKTWTEEWRTNVCGRLLTFDLTFRPGKDARNPQVAVTLQPEDDSPPPASPPEAPAKSPPATKN